jgi:tetratricopeptide (TPR) repeat protein
LKVRRLDMTAATRFVRLAAVVAMCLLAGCGGAERHRAAHIARGERYLADGRLDKARIEFANALQIAPNNAEARYLNGTVMERLGDLPGAASMYQGTIDADPQHAGARAALGRLYLIFRRPEKALELVKPGLVSHPDDPELLTVRALGRAQLKDPAAVSDAERAVAVAPGNEHALGALAGIYSQSGQLERAIDLLRGAVAKAPDSVTLRQVLAQTYLAAHQEQAAEQQLRKIVEIGP